MRSGVRLSNWPLRTQLMVVFALLSMATTAVTTLTFTALSSHRIHARLSDKSTLYARQLQRQLESVAYDDRLSARELFDSLMGDHDIDGLAIFAADGEILEGRGNHPARLRSLSDDLGNDEDALTVQRKTVDDDGVHGYEVTGLIVSWRAMK